MYCQVGEDSDVTAYFHRMGHLVCETCNQTFGSKGGLTAHLREHRQRGDRVPQVSFQLLDSEREEVWVQAMREGRDSIRAKPLNLLGKVLMIIINP